MAKSIIQEKTDRCFLCGGGGHLERHHVIFGTANRRLSEEDGLIVYLCPYCHRIASWAAHNDRVTRLYLQKKAQEKWELCYGNRDLFIARYGKNFLEEESI